MSLSFRDFRDEPSSGVSIVRSVAMDIYKILCTS
jgi:hypothetical protein